MDLKHVLLSLIPLKIKGDLLVLVESFSESLNRTKAYFDELLLETDPQTAVMTQEEWFNNEGLIYNSDDTIEKKQNESARSFYSIGGQNYNYLIEQINKVYPDITLLWGGNITGVDNVVGVAVTGLAVTTSTPSWTSGDVNFLSEIYRVKGTVPSNNDFNKLKSLIKKIMPAHLEPVFEIEVI